MENGGWRMEDGEWRIGLAEVNFRKKTRDVPKITFDTSLFTN